MFGIEFVKENKKILLPLCKSGYKHLIPFLGLMIPRTAYKIKGYNDIPQKDRKGNILIFPISILTGKLISDLEFPLEITLTPITSVLMYFLLVMIIYFSLSKEDERKIKKNNHVCQIDLDEKYRVKTYPDSLKNLVIIIIIYLLQLGIIYVGIHSLKEISLSSIVVTLFSGCLVCLIPGIIDTLCVVEIEGEIYRRKV